MKNNEKVDSLYMFKCYKDLYNELIGKKFNTIIIKYTPHSGNYNYQGYSHKSETKALDDITDLIIDNIVFYAFNEIEILELHNSHKLLKDLRVAAKYSYSQRLPKRTKAKSDGLLGEVLLDIFIQMSSFNIKKLIARAKHIEIGSKNEIKGYDALYFTKDEEEICLWLGQAKAGKKSYCKSSIIEDLQEKYKKEYFANTAFYIADKNEAIELEKILYEINKICFEAQRNTWSIDEKINNLLNILKINKVKIKIPCLITYTTNIYTNKLELKEYIEKEIKEIVSEFDKLHFPIDIDLDYDIIFYIMPVKDINYIRNKIIELKREVV